MVNNTTQPEPEPEPDCFLIPVEVHHIYCRQHDMWNLPNGYGIYIFYVPVLASLFLLGLFGNTIAFLVMSREKSSSITILIRGLALADSFRLIMDVLFYMPDVLYMYHGQTPGILEDIFDIRKITSPQIYGLRWLAKTTSIYFIALTTLERFLAVCFPLFAQRYCTKRGTILGIIGIVIFSTIYNVPRFMLHYITHECNYCRGYIRPKKNKQAWMVEKNGTFGLTYDLVLYYLVLFVVPLVFIGVLNVFIIRAITKADTKREEMSGKSEARNNEANKKIIGVICAFLVLETPCFIQDAALRVVADLGYKKHPEQWRHELYMWVWSLEPCTRIISSANSAINAYIYGLVGKKFRAAALRMLGCGGAVQTTGSSAADTSSVVTKQTEAT